MSKNIIQKILLICILIFIAPSIYSEDIHSILVRSVGGGKAVERIKSLKSVHAIGKVDMNGSVGKFDFKFKFPNKSMLTLEFKNYSMIQSFDGNIAWQIDISGIKTELSGSEKRAFLNSIYLNSYSFLFDDSLKNKRYIGKTVNNGKSYHKIMFMPSPQDTIVAFFSIETGMREIFQINQDMVETITYEKSYQSVENILTPFSVISVAEKFNFSLSQTIESIEIDVPIEDSLFQFQEKPFINYLFSKKDEITIDFELQNGHIFVPVTLNGSKKVFMLLDSGAGASIIHIPLVKELNLDTVGTIPSVGISGASHTQLVQVDSLQIGNITLYNQIAGSLDLTPLVRGKINKVHFGGILGNDFLAQFPMFINYNEKKITLFNPENYQTPNGGNRISFEYYMLIPTIECKIGAIKGKFIVDLGNAFGLILHHNFIVSNNFTDKIRDKSELKQLIGGVGGAVSGIEGMIDSFTIGNTMLLDEKVYLPNDSYGLSGSSQIAGNIGNALLMRYNIFFDYSKNEIILYDNSGSKQ